MFRINYDIIWIASARQFKTSDRLNLVWKLSEQMFLSFQILCKNVQYSVQRLKTFAETSNIYIKINNWKKIKV